MDKHEQIIDGDDKEIIVKDEWVFEKKSKIKIQIGR